MQFGNGFSKSNQIEKGNYNFYCFEKDGYNKGFMGNCYWSFNIAMGSDSRSHWIDD